jgi:hypothetical protein
MCASEPWGGVELEYQSMASLQVHIALRFSELTGNDQVCEGANQM